MMNHQRYVPIQSADSDVAIFAVRNSHVTFAHGRSYAICFGDDNHFLGCFASREDGGAGMAVYLAGTSTAGSYTAAVGNQFYGFNSNAPIRAVGGTYPSRGNVFLPITAVDAVPQVYEDSGATLSIWCSDGELGFNGFSRGFPPAG